ncbi:MAG: hypothetical protein AAF125_21795, partial [Chloroflexota bacterium]
MTPTDPTQRRAAQYVGRYTPARIHGDFVGKHIITVEQFDRPDLDRLFATANKLRRMVVSQ